MVHSDRETGILRNSAIYDHDQCHSQPPADAPVYTQVLIAVIFGGLLGVIFGQEPYLAGSRTRSWASSAWLSQLLKTLAIPLIFFAILDALIAPVCR